MQQITFFILTICCINIFAQKFDSTQLLTNTSVQLETIEAVDSMYNFNFEVAEKQYSWLKQQYPEHPLPYFLFALNEWWKILPNELIEEHDKTFLAYLDSAISKAKVLYKTNPKNLEASYFLSASNGFKARLYAERGNYSSGAVYAKKALNYLMKCKEINDELHPEYMFGTGLYDYYREWIPENKKSLKFIMFLFPKGDKAKGIEALESVATEAFYTRVEAMRYLIKIYANYEKKPNNAWNYIKYLNEQYPNNPYFLRTKAKIAYTTGRSIDCIESCKKALNNIEENKIGFENETGRVCSYFLGNYAYIARDSSRAEKHYLNCLVFTESGPAYATGYTCTGLRNLARMAIHKKEEGLAYSYYQKILELSTNKKSKPYLEAKKFVKKNKKRFKKNAQPIPYP